MKRRCRAPSSLVARRHGQHKVNKSSAQYLFNFNLSDGWYLYTNATITANWNADAGKRWTIPVGGGLSVQK